MPGLLEHSPADVLRYCLIDLAHGALPPALPWPIYVAKEPSAPDDVITIYNTAGFDFGRAMVGGERFEKQGIQIRVRSADETIGYLKAHQLAIALDEEIYLQAVSTGASHYVIWSLTRTSAVIGLGDESPTSKRRLFTVNAIITLRQV